MAKSSNSLVKVVFDKSNGLGKKPFVFTLSFDYYTINIYELFYILELNTFNLFWINLGAFLVELFMSAFSKNQPRALIDLSISRVKSSYFICSFEFLKNY